MNADECCRKLEQRFPEKRPLVVAVTGYGAAGKTTLSRGFGSDCAYFPTDGYIRNDRTRTAPYPDSVDARRLHEDVQRLLDGETIAPPQNPNNERVHPVQPAAIIILDGIPAAFVDVDLTIVVTVDEHEELRRRLERDPRRGRDPRYGFTERRRGVERHILPKADIIVHSERATFTILSPDIPGNSPNSSGQTL